MKKEEKKVDEFLDCTGLYCPVPIYETKKKINTMKKGQVLEMIADDPGSKADIKSWAKSTGNALLKVEKNNNTTVFFIKKE